MLKPGLRKLLEQKRTQGSSVSPVIETIPEPELQFDGNSMLAAALTKGEDEFESEELEPVAQPRAAVALETGLSDAAKSAILLKKKNRTFKSEPWSPK